MAKENNPNLVKCAKCNNNYPQLQSFLWDYDYYKRNKEFHNKELCNSCTMALVHYRDRNNFGGK